MIFNKISANPGLSKEDVVRMLRDDLSRVPTLVTLKELENKGLIVAKKDKMNRQAYKLYVNDESIIAVLLQELEALKENFSRLTNKLCVSLQKQGYPKINLKSQDRIESFSIPAGILWPYRILFDIIIALNHRMLFVWPLKISSLDTLDETFLLVFSTIIDIRKEMIEKFRPYFPIDSIIFRDETRKEPRERKVAYPDYVSFDNMAFMEPLLQTLKYSSIPGVENEQRFISDYLRRIISLDTFIEDRT